MSEARTCYVITGSLTTEGHVCYLRQDKTWAQALTDAHLFESKDEAETVLAEVKVAEAVVTEPYIFPAQQTADGPRPTSAREILRQRGPSTRLRRPDA